METVDIDKISNDADCWEALAPSEATHYDPEFTAGSPWRRKEEDGRWFGEHPCCGWYCFNPDAEQVEKYIARPY